MRKGLFLLLSILYLLRQHEPSVVGSAEPIRETENTMRRIIPRSALRGFISIIILVACLQAHGQGPITTVAGNGNPGFSGDGGPATSATLQLPAGVAVDAANNLYIADSGNNRVRKVTPAGNITTVAGNGLPGFSGDGGPAARASLTYPSGLAADAAGNLYIADTYNYLIRKVDTAGTITTVAGNGIIGFSGDGGPATSARLAYPSGVAVDASGNLYIADTYNYRIRKVDTAGTITTVAGNGIIGFSGDGGPAANAQLNGPVDVAADTAGNLYIADAGNNRIRKVVADGIITSVAGNGYYGFSDDGGPATSASLAYPFRVAVDASGYLFIADVNSSRIRQVSPAGIITTVAGNRSFRFSGDGVSATSAILSQPLGVAVDTAGGLYIADTYNYRIRKVTFDQPSTEGPRDSQKRERARFATKITKGLSAGPNQVSAAAGISTSPPKAATPNGSCPGGFASFNTTAQTALVEDSVDCTALGNKIPLILIHGIHGNKNVGAPDSIDNLNPDYFDNVRFYIALKDLLSKYKIYRFHYVSDIRSITTIGISLGEHIDRLIASLQLSQSDDRRFVIIAHSLGGLVARTYMEYYTHANGYYKLQYGGNQISMLITLGTPHHGTHLANRFWRLDVPSGSPAAWDDTLVAMDYAFWNYTYDCSPCETDSNHPNRHDALWDDYDFRYPKATYFQTDPNNFLRMLNSQSRFNDKIRAYYGFNPPLAVVSAGFRTSVKSMGAIQSDSEFLETFGAYLPDQKANNHVFLQMTGPLLQRMMTNPPRWTGEIFQLDSDGFIPASSAKFEGASVRSRVECMGYDHIDMQGDSFKPALCKDLFDGRQMKLFDMLVDDLNRNVAFIGPVLPSGPQLDVSPTGRLEFGTVRVGRSVQSRLTLSNAGNASLSIQIAMQANSGFTLIDSQDGAFSLSPNQSRDISIQFSPNAVGTQSAQITISNNSINASPQKLVSLHGVGASATCIYSLLSASTNFTYAGGNDHFTVSTSDGCTWQAFSTDTTWLNVTSPAGGNGTGTQTVQFSALANSQDANKTASIVVRGGDWSQSFVVWIDGRNTGCTYSPSSTSQNFAADAGTGSFILSTSSICGWSVVSNSPTWITVASPGLKASSQTVNYSITANTNLSPRTGTIQVQDGKGVVILNFIVTQAAGAANTCSYSLSPSQTKSNQFGGANFFQVGTGTGCNWRASSSDTGIVTIQSGSFGSGPSSVSFFVSQNPTTSQRTGSITVQGDTQTVVHTISQNGQPSVFPTISLPTNSFNLGNALLSNPTYQTVTVQNNGQGVLYVGSIYLVSGTTEFSAPSSIPFVLPSGTSSFTVTLTPTSTGAKTATFRITSNDLNNPAVDFNISATAVPPGSGGIDFAWTNNGVAPQALVQPAVATIGPSIYVLGAGPNTKNLRYDPTATPNNWTQINNSTGLTEGGAAVINGKIYMVGGPPYTPYVQIYNPSDDSWTTGTAGTQRSGAAVAAANGKLYVIGGVLANGTLSALVEEYDPASNQWNQKTAMPTPRSYASAAIVNNVIYVIGGQIASAPFFGRNTEAFDPFTNTWTTREDMPTRRDLAAITVLQSKIYVIGGLGTGSPGTLNTVEEFDPSKPDGGPPFFRNAWASRNSIGAARYGAAAGTVNSKIYVIGGSNVDTFANVLTIEAGTLTAGPAIDVPVTSVNVGDVNVGDIGEATLAIHNVGNALLTLNYSRPNTSDEFLVWSLSSLAAGQSATIRIRFSPTNTGNKSGTLRISSNDQKTPTVDVSLSGRGIPASSLPAGQSFQTVATIPLPGTGTPDRLTVSGGKAYVGMEIPAQLGIVDLTTSSAAGLVTFSAYPGARSGQPAIVGSRAYIPLDNAFIGSNGLLAVADLASNTVIQYVQAAPNLGFTAVWNNFVYVVNTRCSSDGSPSTIQVLETNTNSVIATIPVNRYALGIGIDPQTGRGYVSGNACGDGQDTLAATLPQVFDSNTNTVTGTVDAPFGSSSVAISGTRTYILEYGRLDVVDISSSQVLTRIPLDTDYGPIAATPSFIFAVGRNRDIYVISTATNTVVATLPVADLKDIATDPNTETLYVLSGTPRSIKVIQLKQPDFAVSCGVSTATAAPGGTAQLACSLSASDGFQSSVIPSCPGLPTGASCSFAPTTINLGTNPTPSVSLSVTVPNVIVPGTFPFQFQATDGTLTRSSNLTLVVPTCAYQLAATSQSFSATLSTGSVSVGGTTGCGWTATRNDAWLTITSGSPGNGNGTVNYSVAANTSANPRTGTMTVAGQTFTVIQAGVPATYLVGDAFPSGSDTAPGFGDNLLNNLDLIYALRAVTQVPGFAPAACTDRFDAMDSFALDTDTVRGGDGVLNNLDLIRTLRRITNVDTSRPTRTARGITPCPKPPPTVAPKSLRERTVSATKPPSGALEFGEAEPTEGGLRMPVYLRAIEELALTDLSFSLGSVGFSVSLEFQSSEAPQPTLVDSGVTGTLAVAWLQVGLHVSAGQNLLLGYARMQGIDRSAIPMRIFGADANRNDGHSISLALLNAAQSRREPKSE